MLASAYRLKGSEEIDEVKSKGKTYQSESFGVSILARGDNDYSKFAFIVSKKISKLAVHRNRIERALNEGSRRAVMRVPKGYNFVFLAKKSISTKGTEEILRETENFFIKLELK